MLDQTTKIIATKRNKKTLAEDNNHLAHATLSIQLFFDIIVLNSIQVHDNE